MKIDAEKIKEHYEIRSEQLFQQRLEKTAYGRKYNVEFELNNGECCTFSNILVSVNGNHMYFESEENGLTIITIDKIKSMICIDIKRKCESDE